MPRPYGDRFATAFRRIAAGNREGLDIKALRGREGYRLRIGNYRAIYEVNTELASILVLDAGPRGDIYK